jgi:hypothetical protein
MSSNVLQYLREISGSDGDAYEDEDDSLQTDIE